MGSFRLGVIRVQGSEGAGPFASPVLVGLVLGRWVRFAGIALDQRPWSFVLSSLFVSRGGGWLRSVKKLPIARSGHGPGPLWTVFRLASWATYALLKEPHSIYTTFGL